MMDLADRALLLNPNEAQALLEAIAQQHLQHFPYGRMQDCDRAVCRLADGVNGGALLDAKLDQAYDEGRNAGFRQHHCDGCTCDAA